MLKNTTRVRNVVHNAIETVLHGIKFKGTIDYKTYFNGVEFQLTRYKSINKRRSETLKTFISHYDLSRYDAFYNRCFSLLQYVIIKYDYFKRF